MHCSTLIELCSCWGTLHVLYLLQNGWLQRILQEIVTSLDVCSTKLLTDLRAESIFSMQRIDLSKQAYYCGNLGSFHIIMPEYIASFKSASVFTTADIEKRIFLTKC